jgi:uncharacterized protein
MHRLGQLLARRDVAALVVAVVVVLSGIAGWLAQDIRHEDDLMAFLPADNPEIASFRAINERFGGLDVAIVGIAVDDAYDGDTLQRLDGLTAALLAMPELDHVLSLANVDDFAPDPMGGIRTSLLVEQVPDSPEASAALREMVQAREHVLGTLVSHDGTALVIYAFPAFGADTRATATAIQHAAHASFPDAQLHLGGAPFISQYIYDTTQADMARLTPWAVIAIVVILLVAFRNVRAVALGLISTGAGILAVYATMSVLDMPLNVVLGAMPVILFAVGSAYAIHMLARYSVHAQALPIGEAVAKTVGHTGPVVLTAGLTTAAGLGSFVMMDITPLRQFGALTALGVAVTLLLSVTFVPAVVTLLQLKPRAVGSGPIGRGLAREVALIGRHRVSAAFFLMLVLGGAAALMTRVDDRLDQSAFYDPGSAPEQADRFLRERFGGASFVQIEVAGDLSDPAALRAVRQLSDRIALVDGVHRVQHVGDVVASVNQAMEGVARIPDNGAQAGLLYGFLTGNPAVRQLVDQDRTRALVHVRLSTPDVDATERALDAIEAIVAEDATTSWRMAGREDDGAAAQREALVIDRVRALLVPHGRVTGSRVRDAIRTEAPEIEAADAQAALAAWLQGGESMVPLEADAAQVVAAASIDGSGPRDEAALWVAIPAALAAAGISLDEASVGDLVWSVQTPSAEIVRDLRTRALADAALRHIDLPALVGVDAGTHGRLRDAVAAALVDLSLPQVAVPQAAGVEGDGALAYVVSGTPVLHRGLSRSTRNNQRASLGFALVTVAVLLAIRFRNPLSGLLAAAPTGAALLVVYGGMGLMDIRLDIGTSMLASIVIGAGVDYGVHMLSAWHAREGEPVVAGAVRAASRAGGAIWTNALAVAAGFFVLTLGDARPLKNVGGLTAAAMIVAAGCTFVVLPLLGRRRQYDRTADENDPADPQTLPPLERSP